MSSITLKVSHNDVVRRFRMPVNTGWATLQSHLVSIFLLSINPSLIALTYTDEDGDLVQLNSDEELHDVLQQAAAEGKKMAKFGLVELDELDKDYTMIGAVSKPVVETEAVVEEPVKEEAAVEEPVVVEEVHEEAVVVEPIVEEPATEVVKEDAPPDYQSFVYSEPETSDKGKGPEQTQVPMASELEGLIHDFVSIMIQNPAFLQRATAFKDRVMNGGTINLDIMTKFFERGTSENKPSEEKHKDIELDYTKPPVPHFGETGPSMLMRGFGQSFDHSAKETEPSLLMRGCGNGSNRGPRVGMRGCFARREEREDRRGKRVCGTGRRCGRAAREARAQSPQREETPTEKVVPFTLEDQMLQSLALLKDMGFTDEELNARVLDRYNGNLDVVVEMFMEHGYNSDSFYL
jgi:hypothetical protein